MSLSPLPCPACPSPTSNSAPAACTGMYSVVPATRSLLIKWYNSSCRNSPNALTPLECADPKNAPLTPLECTWGLIAGWPPEGGRYGPLQITVVPDAGGADEVRVFTEGRQCQLRLFPRHKPATLRDHFAHVLERYALHHAPAQHNHVRHKQSDQIGQP